MRIQKHSKPGSKHREPPVECTLPTSASGAGDEWTVDIIVRAESSDPLLVAIVDLTPDEADELAARLQKHAAWCRVRKQCERTCGPARIGGVHVDACPCRTWHG